MSDQQSKDPLHGKTLKAILSELVERYGWAELGGRININCFNENPSIKSSLTFLRKTDWARTKVEHLYLRSIGEQPPRPAVKPRTSAPERESSSSPKPRINLWTGKPFEDE